MLFDLPVNRLMVMAMNNKMMLPVTFNQAVECLYITLNNQVQSIQTSGFYYGAVIDLLRAEEILKNAESIGKLFISDKLGGDLFYDIVAWDQKYQKWVYFECIPEKIKFLKKTFDLKAN